MLLSLCSYQGSAARRSHPQGCLPAAPPLCSGAWLQHTTTRPTRLLHPLRLPGDELIEALAPIPHGERTGGIPEATAASTASNVREMKN